MIGNLIEITSLGFQEPVRAAVRFAILKLRGINPPEGFDSHPGHFCFSITVVEMTDQPSRSVTEILRRYRTSFLSSLS